MISSRLQIGDGSVKDMASAYGFIYLSSDTRFAAPTKGFATSTYAEEAGEHIDPRTVDDAFDYKVKFLVEARNRNTTNANIKIKEFNDLMYSQEGDIKTFNTFTFYNDYKRVMVVGIPKPIAEVSDKDFFRNKFGNVYDAVVVELTIRVTNPSLCNFATNSDWVFIQPRTDFFDFGTVTWEQGLVISQLGLNGSTLTFEQGAGTRMPVYSTARSSCDVVQGNILDVKLRNLGSIREVKIEGKLGSMNTMLGGTLTSNVDQATWSGTQLSVRIRFTESSSIKKITVTYMPA